MVHKYGIYQSSSKSCIFYKQDEDGNQSTFNLFITPLKDEFNKKEFFAFIDNEQFNTENWESTKGMDLKDVIAAFGGWAPDAPLMFEIEAQKSMSQCLSSVLKKKDE